MLRITGYVMNVAPFAVFAAVASSIAVEGLAIIGTFARFMGGFYLSLGILWTLLVVAGGTVIGFSAVRRLLSEIREPFLITFATASSEASYPKLLEALERFGVPPRIASFVLPLGYSFNLDGSMMYCSFASLFIAQAYGIDLSLGQQIGMLLLLMVTSKGIAGVPRASLVVIAATLPFFDIPEAGLLLILAIDHFLDMGRSRDERHRQRDRDGGGGEVGAGGRGGGGGGSPNPVRFDPGAIRHRFTRPQIRATVPHVNVKAPPR